jgi:Peptidase_C39 like family
MRCKGFVPAAAAAALLSVSGSALAAQPVPVAFHAFPRDQAFTTGAFSGTQLVGGQLALGAGAQGSWTSPWRAPGFPFTELVASWNADTPPGTWIQVEVEGVTSKGTPTKAYVLGQWAYGEDTILRTSVGGQGDADGFVAVDTLFTKDKPLMAYRLRARLFRSGTVESPSIRLLGAVVSDAPNQKPSIPSAPDVARGVELAVPTYSQEIHAGEYPEFDGGGEAWCSPTSTSMVLAFWGMGPSGADLTWVDPAFADPWVDHAARYTYDYRYQGAGNWPFNAAYAAHFGLTGFVTQLRSLAEAEQFVKAGIPLVASIAANPNKLTGFLFDKGTNGHLLVIRGFTARGDVVANDPAAEDDASVRRVYDRAEFERAWLPASGGIVYVLYDPAKATLPPSLGGNW